MEGNPEEWLNLELDAGNDHEIIESLVGDLHCPLCGSAYDLAETHVVREHGGSLTLATQCYCCGTGSLISIAPTPSPPTPAPSATELTPVERAFFASLKPLCAADVRRIHQLLRQHRGDLRDLM